MDLVRAGSNPAECIFGKSLRGMQEQMNVVIWKQAPRLTAPIAIQDVCRFLPVDLNPNRKFGRVVKALALGASLERGTGSNPVACNRFASFRAPHNQTTENQSWPERLALNQNT